MFKWANPQYLKLLYLLIPIGLIMFYFILQKINKINALVDESLRNVLLPKYSIKKLVVKNLIIFLVLILLILSTADPQIGTKLEEVKQTGLDVYIVLDVSLSMKADDIKPTRLQNSKFQISSLINRLEGNKIGLIIFSGEPYVQFPLTTDYSAAQVFLEAVDFNSIPQHGTSLSSAINLAVNSFQETNSDKVVIIISDGEDHEGNISDEVQRGVDKGVKFYCIGVGTTQGSKIPVNEDGAIAGSYKTDYYGNIVITKLDESILTKIADEGKGKYYRGSTSDNILNNVMDDINKLNKSEFGVKKITNYEDRFYFLLVPAIILLLLDIVLFENKSKFANKISSKIGLNGNV